MINVFKKIWDFSLKEKRNLQKSMVIGFLNAICNSLLVLALYVVLKAIVENQVSTRTAWTAFAIMVLSIIGKIITQYFSQLQGKIKARSNGVFQPEQSWTDYRY